MSSKGKSDRKTIASNRKAFFDYTIIDTYEAGIALLGSEVKSLRLNKASIRDAYADINKMDEVVLRQVHIAEYTGANQFNHHPTRERKLLLHKHEIRKLTGKLKTKGLTLVPLELYFNAKNRVKVEIALVEGKKKHDKRESIKQREWNRNKQRILKQDH